MAANILKIRLFLLIQWTWGILQTSLGLLVLVYTRLAAKVEASKTHYGARVTILAAGSFGGNFGGVSLGAFIFIPAGWGLQEEKVIRHEYGHCIQSLLLGPLYLFIIGLPSILWNVLGEKHRRRHNKNYYDYYTEKWADRLGGIDH